MFSKILSMSSAAYVLYVGKLNFFFEYPRQTEKLMHNEHLLRFQIFSLSLHQTNAFSNRCKDIFAIKSIIIIGKWFIFINRIAA